MPKGHEGQKRPADVPSNALWNATTWYNFVRANCAPRMSPAMATHLTGRPWQIDDILKLIEDWETR